MPGILRSRVGEDETSCRYLLKHQKLKKEEIIYGVRPVVEAMKSGKEIDRIFLKKGIRNTVTAEVITLAKSLEIPFQFVPIEKLDRLTKGNHQGVIALTSQIPYQRLEEIVQGAFERGETPLILVLDGITDVRNFGAIARTAECAGAQAIVIPAHGSAQVNEEAVRTSAGALTTIPVCRVERLKDAVTYLKESGIALAAATEKASKAYDKADFNRPVAIIMGSEERGISQEIMRICDDQVCIPMKGTIASLNVSVAAGILLFEAIRQRGGQS